MGPYVFSFLFFFIHLISFHLLVHSLNLILASWNEPGNRRKFFENYAKENDFNPLDPRGWSVQPRKKLMSVRVCPFVSFLLVSFLFSSLCSSSFLS